MDRCSLPQNETLPIAFEVYEEDTKALTGYQKVSRHLVFEMNIREKLRHKVSYCVDFHKTKCLASITYITIVSRYSVHSILTISALNYLQVLGTDMQNSCQEHGKPLCQYRGTGIEVFHALEN